jgi:hypothetical protein
VIWSQKHDGDLELPILLHDLITLVICCIIQEKDCMLSPCFIILLQLFYKFHQKQEKSVLVSSATVNAIIEVSLTSDCHYQVDVS